MSPVFQSVFSTVGPGRALIRARLGRRDDVIDDLITPPGGENPGVPVAILKGEALVTVHLDTRVEPPAVLERSCKQIRETRSHTKVWMP